MPGAVRGIDVALAIVSECSGWPRIENSATFSRLRVSVLGGPIALPYKFCALQISCPVTFEICG